MDKLLQENLENQNEICDLPLAPSLPIRSTADRSLFQKEHTINAREWQTIKTLALHYECSALSILLAALGEVISRWSAGTPFSIVLGNKGCNASGSDFLFPIVFRPDNFSNWCECCQKVESQLRSLEQGNFTFDIDDIEVSDLEKDEAIIYFSNDASDFNFCSAIHYGEGDNRYFSPERVQKICLHCSVLQGEFGLKVTWSNPEKLFPEDMLAAMFDANSLLLNWLLEGKWKQKIPGLLPEKQRLIRQVVNDTFFPIDSKLIHQNFFKQAQDNPEREALFWQEDDQYKSMTYGELANKVLSLVTVLSEKGIKKGENVSVSLARGPRQIIAVLAVLAAGAAYVPVNLSQPMERRDRIYRISKIKHLITDKKGLAIFESKEKLEIILVEDSEQQIPAPGFVEVSPDSTAYIIFTSGSTGEPKGVEIAHQASYNTIADINIRYMVSEADRVLAVSALEFDLSVYDIFGSLSLGGALVLLQEGEEREARSWLNFIRDMRVTIWNSVPALFTMLLAAADKLPSLRLVLLSGDWIGLDLYGKLKMKSPNCKMIGLGGATEASIWSNYFEIEKVEDSWLSIPYGKPLSNQRFRVVDKLGRDCPDLVAGELWIGGDGVAKGYYNNTELTARSFINEENQRWYRTGDLGRYWPDGNIEFLGRVDQQVKFRGYRIEIGEIETILRQYPGVVQAVTIMSSQNGLQHLYAAIAAAGNSPAMKVIESAKTVEFDSIRIENWEKQAKITEAFIINLLELNNLQYSLETTTALKNKLCLIDSYGPLIQMWLTWLEGREIIVFSESVLEAGVRFQEVFEFAEQFTKSVHEVSTVTIDMGLTGVGIRLFQKLNIYRDILCGEISSVVLLDDDILSPEGLTSIDPGTSEGIRLTAARIRQLAKQTGKPLHVALLEGRSGIIAAKLLALLEPEEIELTLFESASSMLESAKARFLNRKHVIKYCQLLENVVPGEFRYSYDLVLAINSLHRYPEPKQGIQIANIMLNKNGKIFILEHCELTPIAKITAAVLEKGFANLNFERRRNCNPMLTARQWQIVLQSVGFEKMNSVPIKGSFTEFIEASCSESMVELKVDEILEFAANYLPGYMLPEKIEILPWIPLNINNKVDRKAIEKIFELQNTASVETEVLDGMEYEIAQIWKSLLHIEAVGSKQGFFELGGDSLLATRFIVEVKEKYGIDISLRKLIDSPTLCEIAACMEENMIDINQPMEEGEI
ncbi:MAG: amino acid adenylation domain protein [Clostridiales bacterium]|nr:amino acid adenylation domain protein [Clostridiales bacterium]